ncbi:mitochondrial ribosomal death-associated protein 3-domain-containing protein [Irpex rosettiformis]|uniref:Mitochondrial ribosomal death-associated protein 3-domain-containing protein n=1 Tax=Irpex rosettiformis TaxID=378272 RepID=A0ACB8TUQ4_9APHY|nr:mitochondrial ribosomal death-associated protein 3-domain-containing protein [Irpex rosettiformis]
MSALASVQRARQNVLMTSLPGSHGVGQKRLNSSKWRWVPPEWNKDPNKELKKKLKDSQLKGGSSPSLQAVPVGDGQGSNRPKVPPRFHTLPPVQLKHPLFQSENRPDLHLAPFQPDLVKPISLNKALQFESGHRTLLTAYGVPRNILHEFRILSKPCSLVREVTLSTTKWLDGAATQPSSAKRAVITGQLGSGKSYLLLQAVEYARKKGYLVLYIPRSLRLVDSSSAYVYDPRTRTYLQPEFSAELLKRFRDVNLQAFEELLTSEDVIISGRRMIPKGTTLAELVRNGTRQEVDAPVVLSALVKELQLQSKYPVVLAIDDFQSLYSQSKYRDARFNTLKAYHLSLPRLLLEFASGRQKFQSGAVLGALTTANSEFRVPLELQEALGLTPDVPSGPYIRRKPELVEYAKGLQNIALPSQMSIAEAAALYELWGKEKVLNDAPTDQTFLRLYTESAGNPRDFVWKGVMGSFST